MQQTFPADLLLKTPRVLDKKHKFSADLSYKPRNRSQRVKQRSVQPRQQPQELSSPLTSKGKNIQQNTFKNKDEYNQFADKCLHFLAKKKDICEQTQAQNRQQVKLMFKNIRDELKITDKKAKEAKQKQQRRQKQIANEFLVMRSQIHTQMYKSQDKMEFFRINRATDMSAQAMKHALKQRQKQLRYSLNPFNDITIKCCSASLKPISRQSTQTPSPTKHSSRNNSRRILAVPRPSYTKTMSFHLSGDIDSNYSKKLKSFLDFIFKINYSNGIYVDLSLSKPQDTVLKYKMYIGRGNNSLLVKSIAKRRFWWQITHNVHQMGIDFYWSQNKIDRVHHHQIKSQEKSIKQDKITKKNKLLDDIYELNKKVLNTHQSVAVQKYILNQGFGLPFHDNYQPDIHTNHLPNNHCIGSKKNLFKSLYYYHTNISKLNPFVYLPKTYHVRSVQDQEYTRFMQQNIGEPHKMWIIKPGEQTNRGRAIHLANYNSVANHLPKIRHPNGQLMTYVLQDYISKPLLYNNRKFDIRHYMLLTSVNGIIKGYWYKDGYLRTSSYPFDLSTDNIYVHLTNDAIQKKCDHYQKYQQGNKLSYSQFQRYLDLHYQRQICFQKDVLNKMKDIAIDVLLANYLMLDGDRMKNNFQLLGFDFMIDRDFKPYLIQVNYNPCLQMNCTLMERIVPALIENTFRIGLDPLYPPSCHYPPNQRYYLVDNYLKHCKYQLIFDQSTLKEPIVNTYPFQDFQKDDQQQYADQGKQVCDISV